MAERTVLVLFSGSLRKVILSNFPRRMGLEDDVNVIIHDPIFISGAEVQVTITWTTEDDPLSEEDIDRVTAAMLRMLSDTNAIPRYIAVSVLMVPITGSAYALGYR